MMEVFFPKRREVAQLAVLASAVVGGVAVSRFFGSRKVSAAERLAEALLDTGHLSAANSALAETSEKALAECAAYIVHTAYLAAEGIGTASGLDDTPGYSRTHTHPYTRAVATVLTEAPVPAQTEQEGEESIPPSRLTYAVNIPDVGEVRGTRCVGALKLSGIFPARPTPDTLQITLSEGYNAQIEAEFEIADFLFTGRTRLFGSATLRDNRDNVGRLHIGHDGTISGTITRDSRVVGRFTGRAAQSLNFQPYQIQSGE